MILHTSPRVAKVDRFDADVRIKVSLLKRTAPPAKWSHVKSFMKDFVFDIVRSFLSGNEVPLSCNLFLDSTFPISSGPRVPVVNAEPLLHRWLRREAFVDAGCLRKWSLNSLKSVTEICFNSVNVHHVLGQNLIRCHFTPHRKLIRTWQVRSNVGRGCNGGSGASMRSRAQAETSGFGVSFCDEETGNDTLGVSGITSPWPPHLELVLVSKSIACQSVSFDVLLPIDPSKNLPSNCHFVFQSSLEFTDPGI